MKVLVTGASGFVGINLVRSLTKTDYEPIVFTRDTDGLNGIPDGITAVEGDITQIKDVEYALQTHGCDAVVHLAAMHGRYGAAETQGGVDWELIEKVNVHGSRNVFEAAEKFGVKSLVFAGTLKSHPYFEETDETDYIKSKRMAQTLLKENKYGFEWTVVNPSTVVGPHDFRLVHYPMFQLVCSNIILIPPMYMPKKINFVHVDTVARLMIHFLEDPANNCKLVTGPNTSMRKYCNLISDVGKSSSLVVPLPSAHRYLPFLLNTANRFGLIPVSSSQFNWSDRSVPEEIADRSPVDSQSVNEIVEDSYDWYSEMGLL